jgi:hypothetical protein
LILTLKEEFNMYTVTTTFGDIKIKYIIIK